MYVLRRRWNTAFRQATFAQLTETQREQFTAARMISEQHTPATRPAQSLHPPPNNARNRR
jgi:hypothetical protein